MADRTRYMQTLDSVSGQIRIVKTGSPWEVRLRGLATPVTFYAAQTGGSGFAGTVANLATRNGRIEPQSTPGGELWIDSGISYDEYTTANGQAVTGGNPLVKVGAGGSLSPSVETSVDLNLAGYPGIDFGGGALSDSTTAHNAAIAQASAAALAISPTTVARIIYPTKKIIRTDGMILLPNVKHVGQGTRIVKKNNASGFATNALCRTLPSLGSATAAGNGTTVNGDTRVTGLTSPGGITVGRRITGTGIPTGTYVKSISGTTLELDQPATGSATVALTMAATCWGTFAHIGLEELIFDPDGKTLAAHVLNLSFIDHLRYDRCTVENYDASGTWAVYLKANHYRVTNPTIRGGTSLTSDGLHIAGGRNGYIDGWDIESGDDALVFGANPSNDALAASDPSPIEDIVLGSGTCRSHKGHVFCVYVENAATDPGHRVRNIKGGVISGASGILRNGGVLVSDQNTPAAGSSKTRDVDVKVSVQVGSPMHDDTNPYGVQVQSADNCAVDVDLSLTQGNGAANGFIGAWLTDSADAHISLRCDGLARRYGILAQNCPRLTIGRRTRLRQTSSAGSFDVVNLQDCPGAKFEQGYRILDVKDANNGIGISTGTTTEADIVGGTIEHAAGASSGLAIAATSSAFTRLAIIGNKLQRGANTGSMPVAKTLILGNDGLADNINAVPNYIDIREVRQLIAAGTAAQSFALAPGGAGSIGGTVAYLGAFKLDPADYALNGRAAKLRIMATVITNAVAPAADFTFTLRPIATFGGASGANPTLATFGASLGTATVTAPAAGGAADTAGAEFAFPAAGNYVLAVANSATTAAGAICVALARLQLAYD